jgi:hypothetical protein
MINKDQPRPFWYEALAALYRSTDGRANETASATEMYGWTWSSNWKPIGRDIASIVKLFV